MRVIDPLNTETNFTVNASGLVTAVEHPLSNTTTFAYDNLGRLLTETDPLSNVRTYEYDLAGRLISRTDPKNQVIEHTYNDRNELTRIDYPDLSFVSFAYNDASARTQSPNHTERLDEYCYGMRATSAKTGAGLSIAPVIGPGIAGIFGSPVTLLDGQVIGGSEGGRGASLAR